MFIDQTNIPATETAPAKTTRAFWARYNVCPQLPHSHSAPVRRAVYIVCLFFVFSYIAFDLLDVDGSKLYSVSPPQRYSILALVSSDVEIPYRFADSGGRAPGGENIRLTDDESSRPPAHFTALSLFSLARTHGYKVTLARNSLSDSSSYG